MPAVLDIQYTRRTTITGQSLHGPCRDVFFYHLCLIGKHASCVAVSTSSSLSQRWNNEPAAELRFVAAIDAGISATYVFPLRPDHGSSFYSPADDLRVGAV